VRSPRRPPGGVFVGAPILVQGPTLMSGKHENPNRGPRDLSFLCAFVEADSQIHAVHDVGLDWVLPAPTGRRERKKQKA